MHGKLYYVIGLCALLLVGVWSYKSKWLIKQRCEKIVSCCVYPIIKVEHAILSSITHAISSVRSYKALTVQYADICKERDELRSENILLKAVQDMYCQVAELIEFRQRYDTHTSIMGQLLCKTFSSAQHTAIIDKGSYHGVTQGMIAVCRNALVGRVIQVMPLYSHILLITDARCKVAVYCHETGASGIHSGTNNAISTVVEYITHLEPLQCNDLILSSGIGGVFPRGFAVGYSEAFSNDGLSYRITVRPAVDVTQLTYCYLIDTSHCLMEQ